MKKPRYWILVAALAVATVGQGPVRAGEADKIVDRMVAAHGGMEAWAGSPSVSFTDAWTFPGSENPAVSNVIVETGPRRAHLEIPATGARVGWDGEKCWSLNWKSPMPPRFIATLTYYFVNLPWLVKDPGVVLHEPGRMKLTGDETSYITIRVTYEPGVGDTPDDYYVLFIDPENYRLHGCAYVVTYTALLPEGVETSPEHVLLFESFETVDGLSVPTSFTIYEDEKFYASCRLSNWSFRAEFDPAMVAMPEGAVIDTSVEKSGG